MRSISSKSTFSAAHFPGYIFDREARRVYKRGPDGLFKREIRPRKRSPGAEASTWVFMLRDPFGELVCVHATAIFPGFSGAAKREPPCLEDFPLYYFDEDGTPHGYVVPGAINAKLHPKSFQVSGRGEYYSLRDREGRRRTVSKNTLRKLASGTPVRVSGVSHSRFRVAPPEGCVELAEFTDYAFHPDGTIYRVTFPAPDCEPREVGANEHGVKYIYSSDGRKVGFTEAQVVEVCGSTPLEPS